MLDFRLEWLDAPGVKDQVLASTWARLEMQLNDVGSRTRWLTLCVRTKYDSVQRGVYGSVFPLAEWIVENWWFLLHEPLRVSEYQSGRTNAVDDQQRRWVARHNLLAAREGGALPDLTIYRDGSDSVACWVPDPEQDDLVRPTRFISGSGSVRMKPCDLETALYRFVEAVLERLDRHRDEDTQRLRGNWQAVRESLEKEADLCASSATLGLDPYDPEELTPELVDLLEHQVASQPTLLKNDLLEASSGKTLSRDLDWTTAAASKLNGIAAETNDRQDLRSSLQSMSTAHQVGYEKARVYRKTFDIPASPVGDVVALLHRRCGWPSDPEIILEGPPNPSRLAMIGTDGAGYPRLVTNQSRHVTSRRFRIARSLYFLPAVDHPSTRRLITGAHTWDQRASRAFAAELLAPAAAVRTEIADDEISDELIDDLAGKFNVSSWVIEHQLANQDIG